MSTKIQVEHLARVEGHGGITVELEDGAIAAVRFDIFEGARLLEGLVRGRSYEDVSQILSRICSICSVAHSLTSLKATENAFGLKVNPQTDLLRDLLYRGESIQSHALHLFCLALPDYLDYPSVTALAADHLEAVKLGLRMKKLGNSIQETIGGRAVHPVNAIVGGFGKLPSLDSLVALRNALIQGVADCETAIKLFASLPATDFCHTETVFAALCSPGNHGYYLGEEITVLSNGQRQSVPAAGYRSLSNEKAVPGSHAKHSSFNGKPFMVGSLARLSTNPQGLSARASWAMSELGLRLPSDNPMDNNKAQAVELVHDIHSALEIVDRLLRDGLKEDRCVPVRPTAGTGTGVTEAPRGLLIHSYTYDDEGRITAADVITPTALNAASIENHFHHTVAQSADKDVPALRKKLEMVARAYDPCISCSVHLVQKRHAV
jgi:sulfhydrogenase subunit alpha